MEKLLDECVAHVNALQLHGRTLQQQQVQGGGGMNASANANADIDMTNAVNLNMNYSTSSCFDVLLSYNPYTREEDALIRMSFSHADPKLRPGPVHARSNVQLVPLQEFESRHCVALRRAAGAVATGV